jgi:peptidoglycan hydrolase CwlO-like protein
MLSKLRDAEGDLTELSCRSAQLKESKERYTDQLRDLQDKIQALSERIREQATETEQVHPEETMASEEASDMRQRIRDIDEKLNQ